MNTQSIHKNLTFFIATAWFVNGIFCKILNFVPRHEQIVASILNENYARLLTILIGISEIIMTVWILTRYRSKLNAIVQIVIIVIMNILEFLLVPNLLLWGKLNFAFALFFVLLIYYNEFVLGPKIVKSKRK